MHYGRALIYLFFYVSTSWYDKKLSILYTNWQPSSLPTLLSVSARPYTNKITFFFCKTKNTPVFLQGVFFKKNVAQRSEDQCRRRIRTYDIQLYEAGELTAALSCNITRIPNGIRVRDCSKKGCIELFPSQLTTACLIIHAIIISRK